MQQQDGLALALFANEDVTTFDDDPLARFFVLFD
jgi:hypothetical protein